jgi:hypothetical protein
LLRAIIPLEILLLAFLPRVAEAYERFRKQRFVLAIILGASGPLLTGMAQQSGLVRPVAPDTAAILWGSTFVLACAGIYRNGSLGDKSYRALCVVIATVQAAVTAWALTWLHRPDLARWMAATAVACAVVGVILGVVELVRRAQARRRTAPLTARWCVRGRQPRTTDFFFARAAPPRLGCSTLLTTLSTARAPASTKRPTFSIVAPTLAVRRAAECVFFAADFMTAGAFFAALRTRLPTFFAVDPAFFAVAPTFFAVFFAVEPAFFAAVLTVFFAVVAFLRVVLRAAIRNSSCACGAY